MNIIQKALKWMKPNPASALFLDSATVLAFFLERCRKFRYEFPERDGDIVRYYDFRDGDDRALLEKFDYNILLTALPRWVVLPGKMEELRTAHAAFEAGRKLTVEEVKAAVLKQTREMRTEARRELLANLNCAALYKDAGAKLESCSAPGILFLDEAEILAEAIAEDAGIPGEAVSQAEFESKIASFQAELKSLKAEFETLDSDPRRYVDGYDLWVGHLFGLHYFNARALAPCDSVGRLCNTPKHIELLHALGISNAEMSLRAEFFEPTDAHQLTAEFSISKEFEPYRRYVGTGNKPHVAAIPEVVSDAGKFLDPKTEAPIDVSQVRKGLVRINV